MKQLIFLFGSFKILLRGHVSNGENVALKIVENHAVNGQLNVPYFSAVYYLAHDCKGISVFPDKLRV